MRGINRAIIVGTLGRDPEVKYGSNGNAIVNLSVATSESWKDRQGQKQEKTEWHRIVIFGKLAEIAAQYLKKGSQAYFEGRIETQKWQDQNGEDRYTTQINANQMQMLGGRGASAMQSGQGGGDTYRPGPNADVAPVPDNGFDDIPFNGFDDIPFIDPYKFCRLFV